MEMGAGILFLLLCWSLLQYFNAMRMVRQGADPFCRACRGTGKVLGEKGPCDCIFKEESWPRGDADMRRRKLQPDSLRRSEPDPIDLDFSPTDAVTAPAEFSPEADRQSPIAKAMYGEGEAKPAVQPTSSRPVTGMTNTSGGVTACRRCGFYSCRCVRG